MRTPLLAAAGLLMSLAAPAARFRLARHKDRFWTDSFVNIMDNARRQAGR